ncbi:MAG: amidophosphoribosyltransferase [Bacteroidales bacterium]|jgi:amidophosphoribosyltransferase|nr:amidophosphoribosyltransferase [Bacteroidales bacterium]NLM93096.1 amidophosphoribosyltransferase [Bacteroidales bacterium]
MSDAIKHECGVVLLRLLKPLEYYVSHYGTAFYGLNKLYLLMEKQHNRGQDGAGMGCIKFGVPPGARYMNRMRSNDPNPIKTIFDQITGNFAKAGDKHPERLADVNWLKNNMDFFGELYLGHLRYGTFGNNSVDAVHPFLRENNWMSKNLMIAGNFNLTNVDELFDSLVHIGQHPNETSDTVTILEKMGHFLDEENEDLYRKFKAEGHTKKAISPMIARNLDLQNVLKKASKYWDGGYVVAGMLGHGDAFIMRDPAGIRPAFYYRNDDFLVAASERPAIQTAFNVPLELVKELQPGHALVVKRDGNTSEVLVREPLKKASCSFERIYFSRGTDADIYMERKRLGKQLVPAILNTINHDLENTIFSYIPNTAISAFWGMMEGLNSFCDEVKKERILDMRERLDHEKLEKIMALHPRVEQIAVKDAKLRTFITADSAREDLVAHVYDVTYGVVKRGEDTLVVIDDSIVRGTTLKKSIIRMLDRLGPKNIVIVSSAPQIRYPDCYGIDMARLNEFIAFRAAIDLLKETGQAGIISDVYKRCKEQEMLPREETTNCVKEIYRPFRPEEISAKIAQMLHPPQVKANIEIVFQTIEDLHTACPGHTGDWYFTGNYPTPGGNKVVNRSFINYIEGRNERAY